MQFTNQQLVSAALMATTVASGFWIQKGGLPPADLPLFVHKLSTVANLVLLNRMYFRGATSAELGTASTIAMVSMNLFFLATIGSGGWMSIDSDMPELVRTAHKITPWLTIGSAGTLLWMMGQSN